MGSVNKVMIPYTTYQNGEMWYHWCCDLTGYSYKYFIQYYSLDLLIALFWVLTIVGLLMVFTKWQKIKEIAFKIKENISNFGADCK